MRELLHAHQGGGWTFADLVPFGLLTVIAWLGVLAEHLNQR
jgi:hypothetical protein